MLDVLFYEPYIKKGKHAVKGKVMYNNCPFRFSLIEQNQTVPTMRGKITALDETGKALEKKTGKGDNIVLAKVQRSVTVQSLDDNIILEQVEKGIQALYMNNQRRIETEMKSSLRPDTITIQVAANVYGREFISTCHCKASSESQRKYFKRLQNVAGKLPYEPMQKAKKKVISACLSRYGIGRETTKLLQEFWIYCVEKRYCLGDCPVVLKSKRRRNGETLGRKICRVERLTPCQEDKLYNKLIEMPSGASAAVALMVGGGFSAKQISSMTWGEIIFHEDARDYVSVKISNFDNVGATHNYTRPLFPMAALVIRGIYDKLVGEYGEKKVRKMPIAGLISNPQKAMSADRITAEAQKILTKWIISPNDYYFNSEELSLSAATKILRNTYKVNVEERCNLFADPGMMNYLLGNSLAKDVTADSYTSFSSEFAQKKLYRVMHCLCSDEPIEKVEPDNNCAARLFPETTRSYASGYAEIILAPGDSVRIECAHGVEGTMTIG